MITFAAVNLLSVNNLSKAYGAKVLFRNINCGINYGDKGALVARNGSGKTTLFKILKGLEIPDEGEVIFRKDIRIGFLDQLQHFDETKTIQETIQSADNPYVAAIRRYEEQGAGSSEGT